MNIKRFRGETDGYRISYILIGAFIDAGNFIVSDKFDPSSGEFVGVGLILEKVESAPVTLGVDRRLLSSVARGFVRAFNKKVSERSDGSVPVDGESLFRSSDSIDSVNKIFLWASNLLSLYGENKKFTTWFDRLISKCRDEIN